MVVPAGRHGIPELEEVGLIGPTLPTGKRAGNLRFWKQAILRPV